MTEFKETELDERAIKMAKVLSADAVERAGHGHPGSPVSLAPIAYTLYQHFIKHDPNDPNWEGRDRFILSGGHASLTQYVQLYFSGYGLTLDDLKNFRGGADTRTPGHPEYGLTPGIEMTTGPLGQGFASAIGFAYGQRFQRGLLDPEAPEGESPFDHNIWVICGEGDIEEGISGEAASLAANQQLGNLTVIFDANRIQIEGDTNLVLAEDVLKRFQAYGWYTDEFSFIQPDGSYKEDIEGLAEVIAKAEKAALEAFAVGEADGGGKALTQRAGGHFDAWGQTVLGVARGAGVRAAAEVLEVVQSDAVAGEVQLDVLGERSVATRKDEAIAAFPVGVVRIMLDEMLVEGVGDGRQGDGGTGVAASSLLNRVGRQDLGHVDGALVQLGLLEFGHGCTFLPILRAPRISAYAAPCMPSHCNPILTL